MVFDLFREDDIREEIEARIEKYMVNPDSESSIIVPGEKEALELVKYHEREWKRITKGIDLRDLEETKKMLKDTIHKYNQLQRLKPYGRYFQLTVEGVVEELEMESLIERSRGATYKIQLSAKGLPTKNIEDLTLPEAEKYYKVIVDEIKELKDRIEEIKKIAAYPSGVLLDDLFLAKERCALALRVIGELSDGVIPQNMLREYKRILWNPILKQKRFLRKNE